MKPFPTEKLEFFYSDFEKKPPLLMLLFMVLSLGFYAINWIYFMNKKLDEIDDDSPQPERGLIILFFFPVVFSIIMQILYNIMKIPEGVFLSITYTVWSLIIFLSLKYIYDFCLSYSKVTQTNALFWYIFIYLGFPAVVLFFFNFPYALPLMFFTMITIPAMQSYINKEAEKYQLKKKGDYFNSMHKARSY